MKSLFTAFQLLPVILFLVAGNAKLCNAQLNTWQHLVNAPSSYYRHDDLYFINDSIGWVVNGEGAIFKTEDAGNNWVQQLQTGVYFRSVEFLNKDTGFAGTLNNRFYKTVNGGEDWYDIQDSLPYNADGICGMSHIGNTIYACGIWSTPSYVLKSTDAGKTWTAMSMTAYAEALVDCYFLSEDTGFVSGSTNDFGGHGVVIKTTDGGVTWEVKQITDIGNYVWKMDFLSHTLGYASIEDFSAADSSAILKTTDGGETWQRLNVTDQYIDMEGIGFLNDTLGWCGGWSDGMWQTEDGGYTWTFLNIGENFNRYFRLNNSLMYLAGKDVWVYQAENIATGGIAQDETHALPHEILPAMPNPFSETVTVPYRLDWNTLVRIELFDAKGYRVSDEKLGYLPKGTHQYKFDGSKLQPGEYLFVLKTNERTLNTKLICLKSN